MLLHGWTVVVRNTTHWNSSMMMMMLDVVALYTIFLLTYNQIRVTRFQQPGTRFLNRVISQLTKNK